jgi:pyridoxamine 5'-phosphate oxidase
VRKKGQDLINKAGLRKADMDPNPFVQFGQWFAAAEAWVAARLAKPGVGQIAEANTVALATVSPAGQPSLRMVLLKGYGPEEGFIFYTNYGSRKGQELAANPQAALLFYWAELNRQIRLEGRVLQVPAAVSDVYFAGRRRGSQISAATSPQSRVVPGRDKLEQWRVEVATEFTGREVIRPAQWGGYALHPHLFEFWQGADNRFHDRLQYRLRPEGGWLLERLAP